MADLSQLVIPVKDVSTGEVTNQTFDLKGSGGSSTNFVGTTAEWNALTLSEKAEYKTVDLTDDYRGMHTETKKGTLLAGETSITFTFVNEFIGSDTLIDVYSTTFGVYPINMTTTSTTVTLEFEAQGSDVRVAVVIEN